MTMPCLKVTGIQICSLILYVCLKAERDETSSGWHDTKQQLAELREQHDRHLMEVQADSKTQKAAAHEASAREKTAIKEQLDR